MVSPFPRNRIDRFLLWGAVKLVGSRRPVGKVGETHCVFPGLSIGDRACAVRWGSTQPTVHKFTAPPRHGVRRPVASQPSRDNAGRLRCQEPKQLRPRETLAEQYMTRGTCPMCLKNILRDIQPDRDSLLLGLRPYGDPRLRGAAPLMDDVKPLPFELPAAALKQAQCRMS